MNFKSLILCVFVLITWAGTAQRSITIEDIFVDKVFKDERLPGFNFLNDGRHYTRLVDNVIKKYDIKTGEWVEDLFSAESIKGQLGFEGKMASYKFNSDESMILIISERDPIYRHSYAAKVHVYDLKNKKLHSLFEDGKVINASFSPDSRYIAYVWENDLYYYDLLTEETLPITDDGKKNHVINGLTDWVYEEEFAFVKAFWWSPDSKKIAFLRFDESQVPEFTMTNYHDDIYPEYITFKYPKVGEKNADVSIHLYDLNKLSAQSIDIGDMSDMYIPRAKWTTASNELCIFKLNRHQNHLRLYLYNSDEGNSRVLLEEKNKYYIDIHDDLTFLADGKHFIWTSEKDGYNHVYKYNMKGKELCDLTQGDYDVTSVYGVDEKNELLYYQSAEESPLKRRVYEVNLKGKKKRMLPSGGSSDAAQFSSTYDYYTLHHSGINTPRSYAVYSRTGEQVRGIVDNAALKANQKEYGTQPLEFFDFVTSEGVSLNGYILKPADFDPAKQYPLFMYQYSGPGSQQVVDSWRGTNYWWFQMLAQKGYIIACVDGRGTGARGEEFKKMTYLRLGHYETIDQIEAAEYLGSLPYIDADRIGIFGWSYGGYMSSLCILKGHEVFSTAIAVAPVTNWKWYDTVYTERFMRTNEENEDGYKNNSPVYFADLLEGKYLLAHGGGDDNVHVQNSMEMINALVAANKQFDLYIYPNRNHRINRDNSYRHLYQKMTDFLDENLMNAER